MLLLQVAASRRSGLPLGHHQLSAIPFIVPSGILLGNHCKTTLLLCSLCKAPHARISFQPNNAGCKTTRRGRCGFKASQGRQPLGINCSQNPCHSSLYGAAFFFSPLPYQPQHCTIHRLQSWAASLPLISLREHRWIVGAVPSFTSSYSNLLRKEKNKGKLNAGGARSGVEILQLSPKGGM